MMQQAVLYFGDVYHRRFVPKDHRLRYRVYNVFIDLDQLSDRAKGLRFFSHNRFNLISIHEKDYGDPMDHKRPLKERLIDLLHLQGVKVDGDCKIYMLTYPRVLGFAFNPLTIFYCYNAEGKPIALIYEVRNTFAERHNYILKLSADDRMTDKHQSKKLFHVSPFFDREGHYEFKLSAPDQTISTVINYYKDGDKRLTAGFYGRARPFTDAMIMRAVTAIPFMTVKVVLGILWEALRLWLKGLKVYSHPEKHHYQSSKAVFQKSKATHSVKTHGVKEREIS